MNEIKRYGMILEKIEQDDALKPVSHYLAPKEDGDFVLYSDHMEIMESIGAGGVSGRVTKKTLEQHRAEFIEHYKTLLHPDEEVTFSTDFRTGQFTNTFVEHAWVVWKAARGVSE